MRDFSPNAIRFENQNQYEIVTGHLRGIAGRHQELSPARVYGLAFEFAAAEPDERPAQFEDFVQLRLGDSE